jgi:7-cyano-7-deazaguanine synthase
VSANDQLFDPEPLDGESVILLSGGVDSTALAALTKDQGLRSSALFIDYGQAARAAEHASSRAVAEAYGLPWREVQVAGVRFAQGEIRGRNAFFVHLALLAFHAPSGVVYLGIHAGTGYRDCSPEFVELIQGSLDFHTGGQVRLAAPFLEARKAEVYALAASLDVPFELTYSCEAASTPCGACESCRDRAMLDARA